MYNNEGRPQPWVIAEKSRDIFMAIVTKVTDGTWRSKEVVQQYFLIACTTDHVYFTFFSLEKGIAMRDTNYNNGALKERNQQCDSHNSDHFHVSYA